MKRILVSIIISWLSCNNTLNLCAAELPAPQYDSKKARNLVNKMHKFHGGKDRWLSLNSLSFTHNLFITQFPKHLNPWWISEEQFQRQHRRGYQYYPMENALLVFKNGETWSQNWNMPNPPGMMPFFNYNFIALPWLPLEKGATISYTGEASLPPNNQTYPTVTLQLLPGATQTPEDYFRLFIDPKTGALKGVEYNSTYAPFLDKMRIKAKQFGPGFHVYESYASIDGLKVPQHYSTYFGRGLAGTHAITNIGFDTPYDEAKAHRQGEYVKVKEHPTKRTIDLTN